MVFATLAFWVASAAEAAAHGHHHGHGAPEIDGPAGISALVLIVSVGLLAYNRFSK
jgi:hypothetical protein